ncbi:MAG: GntR family transcriptional regulator [Guyparkeria sp.]
MPPSADNDVAPTAEQGQRGTRTRIAVERLREMIIDGELPPGSRITERAIGEQLGLSRTPLREALKILASEGLVVLEPNRGALVPWLDAEDVDEVMGVLMMLEGMAAPLVCARLSPTGLERIERLHEEMVARAEVGDLMGYFRVNQAIHRAIVEASGNRTVARIHARESGRVQRYRFAGNRDATRWRRAVHEHEVIMDALRARDGELLAALLQAHLRAGWRVARPRLAAELAATNGRAFG